MKAVVIIPARYGSTRLPGKVLLKRTGKYLVQHTYEQALKTRNVDRVIIATDDRRIARAVQGFGGEAVMTSKRHPSGTDRIAEVARRLKYPIIVNLQADEPEIAPSSINLVIKLLHERKVDMATLACPFIRRSELSDPSKVKVVLDEDNYALYFSRLPIGLKSCFRHIGIYGYRRKALLNLVRLPVSVLEKQEKLEQLRALENGFKIKVGLVKKAPPGIDTLKDYKQFVNRRFR